MKILLAASELEPFTGPGEFSHALQALSSELAARGHDVSVALPYYRTVRENGAAKAKRTNAKFSVQVGSGRYPCVIREMRAPNGVQIFFIEREEFFDRSGLYGTPEGDYQDNAARFIFFSKCVVELAKRMEPAPEILHAHNWQTALIPVLTADQRLPICTVLSAHTLSYQGNFWSYDFGLTNLSGNYFSPRGLEYYGSMNLLKAGLLFAQSVILPGPRYVNEAQTRDYGCGLEPVLREQAAKLEGITPGLDNETWNPSTDKSLSKRYSTAAGKVANQKKWLSDVALTPGTLQLLLVTDFLTDQNIAPLLAGLDRLIESEVRVVILGKVAGSNLAGMEFARRRHAGRVTWHPDYDDTFLRQAFAGSDALLCPQPIAPDALGLLRSLRYGVLPIYRACGGTHALAPARHDNHGYGFPYYTDDAAALVDAVRFAASLHHDLSAWTATVDRAMAEEFSWAAHAAATEALYTSVIARSGLLRAA